jgi:hypothetical protein
MIDFRPHHARLRDDWIRWSLAWILGSASTFSFLIALAGDHYAVYLGIAGIWLAIVPVLALAYVLLTVRPVVAHPEGLDVDGELVVWRNCSAPKHSFFSPGRAWITIWTRGGYRDIQLVGHVEEVARLRRQADTFGLYEGRRARLRSASTRISTSDSRSGPSSARPVDRSTISFPSRDTR